MSRKEVRQHTRLCFGRGKQKQLTKTGLADWRSKGAQLLASKRDSSESLAHPSSGSARKSVNTHKLNEAHKNKKKLGSEAPQSCWTICFGQQGTILRGSLCLFSSQTHIEFGARNSRLKHSLCRLHDNSKPSFLDGQTARLL